MAMFKYDKNNVKNRKQFINLEQYTIRPSKHFVLTWMKKWNYDIDSLKKAIERSYKITKVGKNKYEAYVQTKRKSRKIIFIQYKIEKELFIITGAEGT
jgi:hypothetical protein